MKKILWAAPNSLLDTTNGAALSVKEMLYQLSLSGFEIKILGCIITTSPNGMTFFENFKDVIGANMGKFVTLKENGLEHRLLVTRNNNRRIMLSYEEKIWFDEYCKMLDEFQPDFVYFFDHSLLSYLTANEAKVRGIKTVVYLAHPKVTGQRWKRDVDLIFTDSQATAKLYKETEGYEMVCVGTFISPTLYKAKSFSKKNILFVNPTLEKGAVFVIQLALFLEKRRPDIKFEVVESRSNFTQLLESVTSKLGSVRSSLSNVLLTPNTKDMKPIYSRAKVLLVPSLGWESSGRVIVEAMLNSIPIIGSNHGGIAETIGEGGFLLNFSQSAHEAPYERLFDAEILNSTANLLEKFCDDKAYYKQCSAQALHSYNTNHDIQTNTLKVISALNKLHIPNAALINLHFKHNERV